MPTRGICSIHNGQCKFHSTPCLLQRPCPNGICDNIRDEIEIHHRFEKPSWKNTKAEEWCTNSWQVAKCFLPPDGYIDVCHPDDTDFNGFINLIMNCTLFTDLFNDNLSLKGNVCSQARKVGQLVRHAPPLGISDNDLSGCFDALIALLSDITFQNKNPKTKKALKKLKKLQSCSYLTSIDDEIAIETLTSSSSDESSLEEGTFGDKSEGPSNVDNGKETDRDSLSHDSLSLSPDDSREDSHGIQSTANQADINWLLDERAPKTSEADIELPRERDVDGKASYTLMKTIRRVGRHLRWIGGLAVDICGSILKSPLISEVQRLTKLLLVYCGFD